MIEIPLGLLDDLDEQDREKTHAWWKTLGSDAQLEFTKYWDARSDDTAMHGVSRDGGIEWHALPIELRGRIVDDEDRVDAGLARHQLYEFIANHEEVQFFMIEHHFHICRQHPGAKVCLKTGIIPSGFVCDRASPHCPMQEILQAAGRRSVALELSSRSSATRP